MSKSSWWPSWTRPFIEEPEELKEDESPNPGLPWAAIATFVLLSAGIAVDVVTLWQQWTKIGVALVAISAFALLWTVLFRPRTVSVVLSLTIASLLFLQVFSLISHWDDDEEDSMLLRNLRSLQLVISAVVLFGLLNMPFRLSTMSRKGISRPGTVPTKNLRSPEDNLTLLQWMTVSWVGALISVGSKRQLDDPDIWSLPYEFQHAQLHYTFRELKGSVVRRLLRANWHDLVILTILALVELAATYLSPLILQKLLQSMNYTNLDKQSALKWGALILVADLINAQSGVFSLWFQRRAYERSRGEMITMLYEKTLHRKIVSGVKEKGEEKGDGVDENGAANGSSSSANGHKPVTKTNGADSENTPLLGGKQKEENSDTFISKLLRPISGLFKRKAPEKAEEKDAAHMGKILNLMRNDAYEIAQRFWEVQTVVKKPFGFVLSIALVWRLMGPACLAGVAVVVTSQLLNVFLARILRDKEKIRRKQTDTRLQETGQYVETIRHLRYYGWANSWMDRIMSSRQAELRWKIITNLWGIIVWINNALGSDLMIFATFLAFTAFLGRELRIDIAFPALELLGMLQNEIRGLPDLIIVFLNANVAINRLEDFMKEPNKEVQEVLGSHSDEGMLEAKNASFAWPGLKSTMLKKITLQFPPGLHVISGPVASGKSALLKALLGELDLESGELIAHRGPVGYCAQNPWLQSMTIRENIIFGSPYEEKRYNDTIQACALVPDFTNFKDGDQSAVGENGIGLSGGQKARVALARAVYSRAKVLMLDDPLSALDQQTAEFIVDKCLKGDLMEDRTVLLVTHRLDLVRGIAMQRILIEEGEAHVNEEEGEEEKIHALEVIASSTEKGKDETKATEVVAEATTAKKWEDEEERQKGSIKLHVYWEYIKVGGMLYWLILILSALSCRLFVLAETWFIKEWGEAYPQEGPRYLFTAQEAYGSFQVSSKSPLDRFFDRFPRPNVNIYPWTLGILFIVVMQSVSVVGIRVGNLLVTYTAGKAMFAAVMDSVSKATFHYYDITPVGRLMNRLTSDVGTLDGPISNQVFGLVWSVSSWLSAILIIASVTPLFLLVSIALSLIFVMIFMRFLPTSQSLRRLETTTLSPLMSNFGALLEGLMTVRAFAAQAQFQAGVINVVDTFQKMDHFYWSVQAWLTYRFDIMSASSTFILTILAIYSGISPGLTAFVLVSASRFVSATHQLCRQYGQLQLSFVSIERIVELLHVPQENKGTVQPPASWPEKGTDIIFDDVTLRYAPHLEPALNHVSCKIPGGTTTAVTGRTGSGKSTLALSLLATLEPEQGRIIIDGIDTCEIDKQALRSRITFLAQEPVLFPGTLRKNLDPLEQHSDAECDAVLERISGASNTTSALVGGKPWTLTTQVETGGKNLSHGQRQLVGLARAILRRSAIIIMDEATASIDSETAWEVQRILREELKESTVVTIAHRAEAVHGVENCIVLAKGKVIKQGKPGEADVKPGDGAGDAGAGDDEVTDTGGGAQEPGK